MHNFAILYVEDEQYDVFFLKQAFGEAGITNLLQVATSGREAIDYLAGTGAFADRQRFPLPGLILLDLNLPYKTGFDVLKWIREQSDFRTMLVVIFTASDQPNDIEQAYRLGANGYLVKPDPDQLPGLVNDFKNYWLNRNESPMLRDVLRAEQ